MEMTAEAKIADAGADLAIADRAAKDAYDETKKKAWAAYDPDDESAGWEYDQTMAEAEAARDEAMNQAGEAYDDVVKEVGGLKTQKDRKS